VAFPFTASGQKLSSESNPLFAKSQTQIKLALMGRISEPPAENGYFRR
jgi:hypothetical protein